MPQSVWDAILDMKPRDRDMSSPTGVLVKQALDTLVWRRRRVCDWCDERSMYSHFEPEEGLSVARCRNPRCDREDDCCMS